MRIKVVHETAYRYGSPAKSAVQLLRLTPRDHEGQTVRQWRIDLDHPARLVRREDCFGNAVHSLFLQGPLRGATLTATGELETENEAGMVRGTDERFSPPLFLRTTALSAANREIRTFAQDTVQGEDDPLHKAHALMLAIFRTVAFETGATDVVTTAAEAFERRRGVCQDLTHIFLAGARSLGIPARYVSGYLVQPASAGEQDASHAWAEAFLPPIGWVSFDPANGRCATESYVRVATGLDYLDAAPIRGSHHGGSGETLTVRVRVTEQADGQQG